MGKITAIPLPTNSFLNAATQQTGCYADCFEVAVPCTPLKDDLEAYFARYVFVFFDSWVFRLERRILRLAGKEGTHHEDIAALARAETGRMAAWITRERGQAELLLAVPDTPILTWLQVAQTDSALLLRFGSGILPQTDKSRPHWGFRATYWAHRVYSRVLLHAAQADWARGKDMPK
ncbi:MAG: hypothetical protein AAF231_02160 [Pseudomonadota bacterium]